MVDEVQHVDVVASLVPDGTKAGDYLVEHAGEWATQAQVLDIRPQEAGMTRIYLTEVVRFRSDPSAPRGLLLAKHRER